MLYMVKSILSNDIVYKETPLINKEDIGEEASLYEINIENIDVLITVGKPQYTYISSNIIFFPIYLVKNDSDLEQIGVFEIQADALPNILDENDDIRNEMDKIQIHLSISHEDDTSIAFVVLESI